MKRTAKTLIVDDSVPILLLMEKFLNLHGIFDVTTASDGVRGLELFERETLGETPYSLVFLDVVMPGMDGLETLKWMRAMETNSGITRDREATIIMISGVNSETINVTENSYSYYLAKPLNMHELQATLARYDFL